MSYVYDFPNKFNITVTTASGVEKTLKSELARLGVEQAFTENGAITFAGDCGLLAKCNLNLRTADRVFIEVNKFTATTFNQLFDNAFETPWEYFLPKDARVIVNGKCVKSELFSISDCQKIIKKAIVNRLCEKYGLNSLSETGSVYEIDFYLFKNLAYLRLNTSGQGLHKRGYRDLVGIAPIKETLGSALLLMSDFYYKRPFIDPFCGSGTLAIEGARICLDIAPGINRRFAFNTWKNFNGKFFELALEQAKDNEKRDRKLEFCAYDVDKKAIALAKRHAQRAGVEGYIKFAVQDVKNLKSNYDFGTIVTNPPYGERVYDKIEAEECYKKLGAFKKANEGWSVFAITSAKNFEKHFGKKAERERKMYNSNKECKYYFYYGKKGRLSDD